MTDMQDPKFELGMLFSTHKHMATAIRYYSIKHGKQIKITNNEKTRVRLYAKKDASRPYMALPCKVRPLFKLKLIFQSTLVLGHL